MTKEKVIEVIGRYRRLFEERGIGKTSYPDGELLKNAQLGLEHCHWMLDQMIEFVQQGRMEKVFRWLGFIQGVLWMNQIYTLEDLKNHNKRPEEEYR